jgi:hypothetical protein
VVFGAGGQDRTADTKIFLFCHSRYREDWTISSSSHTERSWALAAEYCWDSLHSLYTFFDIKAHRSSARDCPQGVSPNSPSYTAYLTIRGTEIQSSALPLSYPGRDRLCNSFCGKPEQDSKCLAAGQCGSAIRALHQYPLLEYSTAAQFHPSPLVTPEDQNCQ